jgi:tRNA (guanine-N7-)-methyltransferase
MRFFKRPLTTMQNDDRKKRTVRSFVRRAGRLTDSQKRALDELAPVYLVDYSATRLSLPDVFGRDAPVVLEIGFGNGETFVEQAAQNPERDFLGIEVHEPGVGHCLLQAKAAGVTNVRVIMHDAVEVLANQVPSASLDRLNLYFPDPWPKKRHHKRRIVQDAFIELVADRLRDGGTLNIATDWANYAEHIDDVMSRSGRFECIERRTHDGEAPLDRPQTKFERRGLRKGHRIWDWCFTKK